MTYVWPYANESDKQETIESDVLVLGGGLAGCYAAIAAAKKGCSVVLIEKSSVEKSGSGGTGFDHWESACTNPCCKISPEEMAYAYFDEQEGYSNGISHYIECREGYDRLLDMEQYGGKIRDTKGEFKGAEFRDDKTGLMFAYDYQNRYTLRVWGTTFKPSLAKELKRCGVNVYNRTEVTSLLVRNEEGKKRGIGAMGMNVRTGKFCIFHAKATVICLSRPARVWLFNPDTVGLCEFRPLPSIGTGHAMGWRAGLEFTMMEKSVRAEFSAAGRSFPPYGTGNNHNTWYAATMVDARGVEIPYIDRDGHELKTVSERYYPAPGQKFFLKGGVIDNPKYEYRGPETLDFDELMKRGYELPFYADLSRMPDDERRVIWGMMVGEEAKTRIPIYQNYTERGFDPTRYMLQSYGTGWQSASFLDQERQFFGAPGGLMHDWDLKTNIDGIYAAGDALYASDCAGHACATGHYAGRKAADYARNMDLPAILDDDVEQEKERIYAPLFVPKEKGINWKELNMAISKAMQNYCGAVKCDALLQEGLDLLRQFRTDTVPRLSCSNPHDLMRTHEVLDILDVSELVLEACLSRKASSSPLFFKRSDYPHEETREERHHIVIHKEDGHVITRSVPQNFFGDLKTEYEKRNQDYIESKEEQASKSHAPHASAAAISVQQSNTAKKDFKAELVPCSTKPIQYDASLCIGCGRCAEVCPCDILLFPAKEAENGHQESGNKNTCPTVVWPGECYYCGACVMVCPRPGAIHLTHPLMNQAKFVPVKKDPSKTDS